VAGSYRAECKRVVVVQRHGAFPSPSALAQAAALRRCLSWGALCWTISLNSSVPFTPVLWLLLSGTIFESQQVMGPENSS